MSFYSEFSECYEETFPLREEVYRFLHSLTAGDKGNILDLGCGTGHYCNRFHEDGFSATGVDSNAEMIEAARKKYPAPFFYTLDIMNIDSLQGPFDCIFSIGNVLAHIPREKLDPLLQNIRTLLKPDGKWIFQVVNWDYIVPKKLYTFPVRSLAEERLQLHRSYEGITQKAVLFHSIMKEGETILFDEKITLYPLLTDDCIAIHHDSGFALQGLYADFQKKTYRKNSESGAVYVFKPK